MDDIVERLQRARETGRREERERCAKIAEEYEKDGDAAAAQVAWQIADRIRNPD